MPGLGRRFAPDPRDANFPMRAALPAAASTRTYRYWNANGFWFDQGTRPICVGAAWAEWLEDGPVSQPGRAPILSPEVIYAEAQKVDEWPGEEPAYEGTSVRAGAKVLKARGFISEYRWASTVQEIIAALLDVGPVVVGVNWYREMNTPDEAGLIHIGGELLGGHAFVLNGVSMPHKLIRMKQSWGRENYGKNGFAYLAIEDVDHLLHEDGEACLAVEVRK
jgi:hypothetical protein